MSQLILNKIKYTANFVCSVASEAVTTDQPKVGAFMAAKMFGRRRRSGRRYVLIKPKSNGRQLTSFHCSRAQTFAPGVVLQNRNATKFICTRLLSMMSSMSHNKFARYEATLMYVNYCTSSRYHSKILFLVIVAP